MDELEKQKQITAAYKQEQAKIEQYLLESK